MHDDYSPQARSLRVSYNFIASFEEGDDEQNPQKHVHPGKHHVRSVNARLRIQHQHRNAISELFNHRGNHHGPEAHGILCEDQECDLPCQSCTHEAVIKRGMGDRRRIFATDKVEDEIKRREYEQAPNSGNQKYDSCESQLFASHRKAIDAKSRCGDRATELKIIRGLGDVHEHVLEIPSHRDLLDWVGKLAI